MKIALCTIYYNDLKGLERLWNSIKSEDPNGFDYWFVIDGRFDLNDSVGDISTDGSREFIESLKENTRIKIIHQDFIGTEHDKRNQYLKLCEEYKIDVSIHLDSDEYFPVLEWDRLRETIPKLNQKVNYQTVWSDFNGQGNSYGWYPRIWLRPYELEYWNAHCLFKNKITGIITRSTSVNNFEGFKDIIRIMGDDTLRDKEYLMNTFNYQKKMIERERIFRKTVF